MTTNTEILLDLAPSGKGFMTASELIEMLPHGSGIDCAWRVEPMRDGVECFNSFHMMNENGMYDGYADFSVKIFHHRKDVFHSLHGPCAGMVQVLHRKGDLDFKVVTRGSAWRRVVAADLAEYIHECVYFALESILTKRNETIKAS